MTTENKTSLDLLAEELDNLYKASEGLRYAFLRCSETVRDNTDANQENDLHFEAMTAKFGRLCEYMISKVLRTVDELEMESHNKPGRIHAAEKLGLLIDGERLITMYRLRHVIAHEYAPEIEEIYQAVLDLAPDLLEETEHLLAACRSRYFSA